MYRKSKKNAIKDSCEKESAVSFIKKFVMHLWNPEMGAQAHYVLMYLCTYVS
jgi:hypothetical protein